jgi:hydrogenase expression/formation protein HypE
MSEREGSQRERGASRTGAPALAPGGLSEERTLRRKVTEVEVGERIEAMRRRRPRFVDERITTAHGAGGKASRALVEGVIVPLLENDALAPLGDAALLEVGGARLALTTDAFVVRPIRFPGGSIGELAVNGTVNDLAVTGARPLALSVALVLEEGLPADVLRAEVTAMAEAARAAGVPVVTGDTKVVERGKCDSMYVVTTGVGVREHDVPLGPEQVRPGDKVLVSGTIGDHGVAIMLARGDLDIEADIRSDTRPLWTLAAALLDACGPDLHCMRDATRGGVATVLNEIALAAEVGVVIAEDRLPLRREVVGAGEILGIDPLYVANEGKLVVFVAADRADAALAAARSVPAGADAALVGEVRAEPPGRVLARTGFGGHRMIDMLVGDPLPRIC